MSGSESDGEMEMKMEIRSLKLKVAKLEDENEELKEEKEELEMLEKKARKNVVELRASVEDLEEDVKELEKKIEEGTKERKEMAGDLAEKEEMIDKLRKEVEEAKMEGKKGADDGEVQKLKDEVEDLQMEIKSLKIEKEKAVETQKDLQEEVDEVMEKYVRAKKELGEAVDENEKLEDENGNLKGEVLKLKKELEEKGDGDKVEKLEEELKKAEESLKDAQDEVEGITEKFVAVKKELLETADEKERLEDENDSLKGEILTLKKKIESFEDKSASSSDDEGKDNGDHIEEIEKLEEELKAMKIEKIKAEENLKDVQEEVDDITDKYVTAKKELSDAADENERLEDEVVALKGEISSLKKKIESLEDEESSGDKEDVQDLKDEIALLKKSNAILTEAKEDVEKELEDNITQSTSLKRELMEKEDELGKKDDEIVDLKSEIITLKKKVELAEDKSDKEDAGEELEEALAKNNALKRELLEKEDELNKKDDEIVDLKSEIITLKKKVTLLEEKESSSSDDDELTEANHMLKKDLIDAKKEIMEMTSKCDDFEEQLKAAKDENADLKKEIEELKRKLAEGGSEEASDEPATPQRLTHIRRAAAPGRRAPTRKKASDLEGAVSVMPAGLVPAEGGDSSSMVKMLKARAAAREEPTKSVKLIQLKGRRNVYVWQVFPKASSMNAGDVFILEINEKYWQWNGKDSNKMERSKAVDIIAKLTTGRGGSSKAVIINQGKNEDDEEAAPFWEELGSKDDVKSAEEGGDDINAEEDMLKLLHLFKLNRDSMEFEEMARDEFNGKLSHTMLDTKECYLLDAGCEIYVWIGKSTTMAYRNSAYAKANEYLEEHMEGRAEFTRVVKCMQGGENILFCEKFFDWPGSATLGPQKFNSNVASSKKQETIDVDALIHAEPSDKYQDIDVDEGDGRIAVYRVENATHVDQPAEYRGHLWSGHTYMVVYTYNLGNAIADRSHIMYIWIGMDTSKADAGTSAGVAINLGKTYRGSTHVRMLQHNETPHFLKMLGGKFCIHRGTEPEPGEKGLDKFRVFHVRGTAVDNTKTVEIEPNASMLNNNDVFLCGKEDEWFIWKGENSSAFALEKAQELLAYLNPDAAGKTVEEGSEPAEFWAAFGETGAVPYANEKIHPKGFEAMCYEFTPKAGAMTGDRLWRFSQADLKPKSFIMLDGFNMIYLYMGKEVQEKDKKVVMETAIAYSKAICEEDSSRPGPLKISRVGDANFPVEFCCHFHGWRSEMGKLVYGEGVGKEPVKMVPKMGAFDFSVQAALEEFTKTYTYEELLNRDKLPASVDKGKLEMYLSDADFETVFKMTREQYLALPQWQRIPKKKAAKLF